MSYLLGTQETKLCDLKREVLLALEEKFRDCDPALATEFKKRYLSDLYPKTDENEGTGYEEITYVPFLFTVVDSLAIGEQFYVPTSKSFTSPFPQTHEFGSR